MNRDPIFPTPFYVQEKMELYFPGFNPSGRLSASSLSFFILKSFKLTEKKIL